MKANLRLERLLGSRFSLLLWSMNNSTSAVPLGLARQRGLGGRLASIAKR